MTTYERWIKKCVLITVRTYPVPSRSEIEVSCTAGITDDGRWIRLYPIPYRFLNPDMHFRKYQYIDVEVTKALSDPRPESYHPNLDSMKVIPGQVPSDNKWEARKAIIFPLKSKSLCALRAERDKNKEPTLGFFKPKAITAFKIEESSSEWTEQELAKLRQYPLFGNSPKQELVKVPYVFKYEFKCDEPNCPSHSLSCTDWEIGQSCLAWRGKYGAVWREKFRQKYETEMIVKNDTHFYVGTIHGHPDNWIIIGLFYPPK